MKTSAQNQKDPQQIWIRFQEGDEQAFAEIYNTYIQIIYNYAKRYTQDHALIEDTIHNLFIYLWQNRSKLSVPLSIKFYLFSAIKRRILKELLRRKEVFAPGELAIESDKHAAEYSVEVNYIQHQKVEKEQERLQTTLNLLSGNQRQAIELRYYSNLSCQKISGIMGIHPDNVYKLISRGLGVLKKNCRFDGFYTFFIAFTFSFMS